jgi:hypothetical protein
MTRFRLLTERVLMGQILGRCHRQEWNPIQETSEITTAMPGAIANSSATADTTKRKGYMGRAKGRVVGFAQRDRNDLGSYLHVDTNAF